MTERSIALLQQALSPTEEERADLAGSLLNSLDNAQDAEASWQTEIAQRASRLDSGEAKTVPWPAVQSRISAALRHGPQKRSDA
jgi:putative addiction module component (TIGR02574 family)